MKNCCFKQAKREKFISNYEIKYNQIIVTYTDGEIEYLDYSIQNEKRILKKMRVQTLKSSNFLNCLYYKLSTLFKLLVIEFSFLILFVIAIVNFNAPLIVSALLAVGLPISIIITVQQFVDCKIMKDNLVLDFIFLSKDHTLMNATVAKRSDEHILKQDLWNRNNIANTVVQTTSQEQMNNKEMVPIRKVKRLCKNKDLE